jgi:hypothetical protein
MLSEAHSFSFVVVRLKLEYCLKRILNTLRNFVGKSAFVECDIMKLLFEYLLLIQSEVIGRIFSTVSFQVGCTF